MRPEGDPIRERPLISIGMPVLNGARFLRRALDCLLAQTVSEFELILSDNASTDASASICAEYARSDSRIRMVRRASTLPGAKHFLILLAEARGDYFMWAACDDEWAPTFIETLLRALETNPGAIGAFCSYTVIDEMGVPMNGVRASDYSGGLLARTYKFCWHYDDACFYGLFRREAMGGVSIPVWWWVNASLPLNAVYPAIHFLLTRGEVTVVGGPPLWFCRIHGGQAGMTVLYRGKGARSYLALLLRKLNVLYESVQSVYQGSASLVATAVIFPGLVLRCGYDCAVPFGDIMRQLANRVRSKASGRTEMDREP